MIFNFQIGVIPTPETTETVVPTFVRNFTQFNAAYLCFLNLSTTLLILLQKSTYELYRK